MKKYLALIGTAVCILGLTACGGKEEISDYAQQKLDIAEQHTVEQIIPMLQGLAENGSSDILSEYTAEEVEYYVGSNYSMNADGNAVKSGVASFESALETIGGIVSIGDAEAAIDDNQIIVNVNIDGELKDAKAEVILSNDMFFQLESVSLTPVSSMGELMGKAALNTVLGMGTVFAVLILISALISCFKFISKAQDSAKKKAAAKEKEVPALSPVQEIGEEEGETDDLELAAVIAAAIAASEGEVPADGFVVRSIRKGNRSRR